MDHTLKFGGNDQTLITIALNSANRPARASTATYRILNLRAREDAPTRILASGDALVDPTTATLAAKAGQGTADPQHLHLTAPPTDFKPGHRYLIHGGGFRELLVVEDLHDQGIRTKTPLTLRYPAGATVEGLEVSCIFPAEVANSDAAKAEGAVYAVDWDFSPAELRDTRELITLERRGRARLGSVPGVYGIDRGLATYVGDRRRVGDALEQANREILAELAIAGEQPLHLGDIGNLAAEYRALHLLYKPMGDTHAEMARWARERAEYFLTNVKVGDKPRGVVELDRATGIARRPTRRGLFKRS